jgi:hypothetical protein
MPPESNPQQTDAEVMAILTQAMADVGATPAAVYAFHKTGVYLTDENESTLSPGRRSAWNEAIEEFNGMAGRTGVVV